MPPQAPAHIRAITPYPPGKPLDELEREYGITDSIKLASNENPWGPSPRAVEAAAAAVAGAHRYPDGSSYYLCQALAAHHGVDAEEIVPGNGSNEVIEFLVKAYVEPGDRVITSHPSFLMYQKFVQVRGGENQVIPLRDMGHDLEAILDAVDRRTRLIFLDNPNNPCATALDLGRFAAFVEALPGHVIVALDEAYVDFMDQELRIDLPPLVRREEGAAVVGLRTFSKAHGLAGLRVGYGIMHREIAAMLHRVRQPFNISLPAQAGALAALEDQDFHRQTLERTRAGRDWLVAELERLGCRSYPSQTNFFLIDIGGDAAPLYEAMLRRGVIVRAMGAYGYPRLIRITVGTREENRRFIAALAESREELGYG